MSKQNGENNGQGPSTGLVTKTRPKTKRPSLYKVLMLNDDYTPMEFVVMCLKRFFSMDLEQATRVMLHVHQKGVGICGVYPYEIAETKVNQVCLLYTSPSPRDRQKSRMPSSICCLEKVMTSPLICSKAFVIVVAAFI